MECTLPNQGKTVLYVLIIAVAPQNVSEYNRAKGRAKKVLCLMASLVINQLAHVRRKGPWLISTLLRLVLM
jgi:hypothetical protein